MKSKIVVSTLLAGFLIFFQSCSKDEFTPPRDISLPNKIETVLNGNDQNLIDWLNKVRGSVGKRGPGSKTIWSRKNDYGLGLYISANHVYNLNTWRAKRAEYFDPASENLGIFESSQIPGSSGDTALGNVLVADFPLIHFDISSEATNTTLRMNEDFYLGIIDNQRVQQPIFPQYPNLVQTNTPLEMYDPFNRSKADQTWNDPVGGESSILVGYPQDIVDYPNGAVAFGIILSDEEAEKILIELQHAGDAEGDMPYQSNVEFFIAAQGIAGMSGGGVFNDDGQLLGIMLRASDAENAPKIIRAVKISYIKLKLFEFYKDLPQTDKNKLQPFIGDNP
ncbi:MAG: hypothetical protein WKF87_15870 [Chryseolinea sp.]